MAEDIDGSGTVDVNDLLSVLSAFGRECTIDETCSGCCPAGASCFAPDPPCCANLCASVDCNAHGTCDAGVCTCDAGWIGEFCDSPAANDCAMGADCGGQQWNDCGSSCPSICGEPPAQWCNEMCERVAPAALADLAFSHQAYRAGNAGFFCPGDLWWDGGSASCVAQRDCAAGEPQIGIGRPFMDARSKIPLRAGAVDAMSDWASEF